MRTELRRNIFELQFNFCTRKTKLSYNCAVYGKYSLRRFWINVTRLSSGKWQIMPSCRWKCCVRLVIRDLATEARSAARALDTRTASGFRIALHAGATARARNGVVHDVAFGELDWVERINDLLAESLFVTFAVNQSQEFMFLTGQESVMVIIGDDACLGAEDGVVIHTGNTVGTAADTIASRGAGRRRGRSGARRGCLLEGATVAGGEAWRIHLGLIYCLLATTLR